jgi:hypothetical protein
MRMLKAIIVGVVVLLAHSALAAINFNQLSEADTSHVQLMLSKLEPLIKQREAAQSLSTLTFDELYAALTEQNDRDFLKEFQNLKGDEIGVTIPFRGIATGKEELVVIRDQNILVNNKPFVIPPQYLPPDVHQAYSMMMDAMQKDLGKRLYVESGYRSSAYQLYLFIYYLKNHEYSIRETVKWVALPGYSEHGAPKFQAIDFISREGENGDGSADNFEKLPEYAWLQKNAGKFGFELSYPRGEKETTFEPWHWRWKGIEAEK